MNYRYEKILENTQYKEYINRIAVCELDRMFCCHDLSHFIDVARIATILNYEENLNISRDLIYASALLHDIGRFQQYENGTPHNIASAELCVPILETAGYEPSEITLIVEAILNHRDSEGQKIKNLSGVIYRADKFSRACFSCQAYSECHWSKDQKNSSLKY